MKKITAEIAELLNDSPLSWLVGSAAIAILICALRLAAPLLTQILIIVFLTIIISPIYELLRRCRIPARLSVWLMILLVAAISIYSVVFVIIPPVTEFSKQLPSFHKQLIEGAKAVTGWLQQNDINVPDDFLSGFMSLNRESLTHVTKDILSGLFAFTKNALFILILLAFMICELPRLPHTLKKESWMTPNRWSIFKHFIHDVRHYMIIKTIISAATGILIYIGLRFFEIPYAGILALIAFLLNFVPIIGSIIASAPGILFALLTDGGLSTGIWIAVIYFVVNQLLGNIIEPRVMGEGFGVSPVLVIFSVMLWGWVLGPVGMLVAVPITLSIRSAISPRGTEAPGHDIGLPHAS